MDKDDLRARQLPAEPIAPVAVKLIRLFVVFTAMALGVVVLILLCSELLQLQSWSYAFSWLLKKWLKPFAFLVIFETIALFILWRCYLLRRWACCLTCLLSCLTVFIVGALTNGGHSSEFSICVMALFTFGTLIMTIVVCDNWSKLKTGF